MKKAQIKMMETIAILIVFFVLVMFSLVAYFSFKTESNDRESGESNYLKAVSRYNLVYHMPEFQASLASIEAGSTFDLMKLDALSQIRYIYDDTANEWQSNGFGLINEPEHKQIYIDLLGYSTVEVQPIYTWNNNHQINKDILKKKWTIFDNPKKDKNDKDLQAESFTMPVALYDQLTNTYFLGQITIKVYDG